jgi:hypothetical protein
MLSNIFKPEAVAILHDSLHSGLERYFSSINPQEEFLYFTPRCVRGTGEESP